MLTLILLKTNLRCSENNCKNITHFSRQFSCTKIFLCCFWLGAPPSLAKLTVFFCPTKPNRKNKEETTCLRSPILLKVKKNPEKPPRPRKTQRPQRETNLPTSSSVMTSEPKLRKSILTWKSQKSAKNLQNNGKLWLNQIRRFEFSRTVSHTFSLTMNLQRLTKNDMKKTKRPTLKRKKRRKKKQPLKSLTLKKMIKQMYSKALYPLAPLRFL